MKFGIRDQLTDLITCVKFLFDRFRGYGVLTPPILPFPIDLLRRPYNSSHYRATLWFDSFTSRTLVYGSEETDTLEDLHRSWTAIQTQIEVGKDFNVWRFLVESKIHEYNRLRKLRKIVRVCDHLIKITRKPEPQPPPELQAVQFTVLI